MTPPRNKARRVYNDFLMTLGNTNWPRAKPSLSLTKYQCQLFITLVGSN